MAGRSVELQSVDLPDRDQRSLRTGGAAQRHHGQLQLLLACWHLRLGQQLLCCRLQPAARLRDDQGGDGPGVRDVSSERDNGLQMLRKSVASEKRV